MRKFLLSALLLLCVRFYQNVSSDTVVVAQSPDVSIQEGETGKMSCCWKGKAERVGIHWLKNQIMIKTKTAIAQSTGSQNEQINTCSVLTFPEITSRDSGRHICRVTVDIPVLKRGTITITARETPADQHGYKDVPQEDFLILGLRCLPILALIASFLWLYCLGTITQRDTGAASKNEAASSQSAEEHQETKQEIKQEENMDDERTTEAAGENEEMM